MKFKLAPVIARLSIISISDPRRFTAFGSRCAPSVKIDSELEMHAGFVVYVNREACEIHPTLVFFLRLGVTSESVVVTNCSGFNDRQEPGGKGRQG